MSQCLSLSLVIARGQAGFQLQADFRAAQFPRTSEPLGLRPTSTQSKLLEGHEDLLGVQPRRRSKETSSAEAIQKNTDHSDSP